MKCWTFGHLKKTTLLLLAALLSFLPLLSGVLSFEASAISEPQGFIASIANRSLTFGNGQPVENLPQDSFYALYSSSLNGDYWIPRFGVDERTFGKDQIIAFDIFLANSVNNENLPSCLSDSANFEVLSCDLEMGSSTAYWRFSSLYTNSDGVSFIESPSVSGYNYFKISLVIRVRNIVTTNVIPLNGRLVSGATSVTKATLVQVNLINIYESNVSLHDIYNSLNSSDGIKGAIEDQTQQQQEYHDEAVDASNDAGDVSDSQGQQAESSGTTLLAAFTSFVSAVTSASPTSCVISGDLGIGGFSTGNLDLCAFSPPPVLQVVSSLILIGALVPISIFTARKMINLFRSFTNG
jgi:hypothetical protein